MGPVDANVEMIARPMVLGARIHTPAISVFWEIAFGAWLWHATGGLIATPALKPPKLLRQISASSLRAASSEEAGFWPVTSLPSTTTNEAQSAPFS